jgi:hypothetical protein
MNTATTNRPSTQAHKRSQPLRPAQVSALKRRPEGSESPRQPRATPGLVTIPKTGAPRPGGRLAGFAARQDSRNAPVCESGLVYVSVEGQHPRKAVLGVSAYERITARDPSGPWLTRTRWWLDEQGLLRAFSGHEQPMTHGVLVAAAVLGAHEGDTIETPADPFDLRLSVLRKVPAQA